MKLAIKLSSLLILGMVGLLGIDAFLTVRRETAFFRADMEHDARLLGRAMKTLIADIWSNNGQQRALRLIDEANSEADVLQMRWVWLDAAADKRYRPRIQGKELEYVAHGAEVSVQQPQARYDGRLVTYVPVPVAGGREGALELSESMAQLRTYRHRIIARLAAMMGGLLAAGGLTISVLGTLIVGRPLGRLVDRVRRIGQGDLETELRLRTGDELSELATALNRMCCDLASARETARTQSDARIAALEQLRHADRLATVGRLASGVAHEVGTPLNVILARAKQIENAACNSPDARDHAAIIVRQSERIATIIRQLLAFARPSRGVRERVELCGLAQTVVALLQPLAAKRRVTLLPVDCTGPPPMADVNRPQIEHVLANLVDNAIQAMRGGGEINTRVGMRRARSPWEEDPTEATYAFLEVEDHGIGIPDDTLPKVFDPFFTTKEVGEGTGLGLSLAFGIVREHHGWIAVTSEVGKGSCFTVFLPPAISQLPERGFSRGTKESARLASSKSSIGM